MRSTGNRLLMWTHFSVYVVGPGLLAIWATTLGESASLPGGGATRVALLFVVLPIYFIYMAIILRRGFPRHALGELLVFLPLCYQVGSSLLLFTSVESLLVKLFLGGAPLFVGFTVLLAGGLTYLAIRRMVAQGQALARLAVLLVFLAIGCLPAFYVAVLGFRLEVRVAALPEAVVALQYLTGIGLVIGLHVRPLRAAYQAGEL